MQTYREFRPTGVDCKGLGLHDQQTWFVVPCARNRDSDCLDESNFAVAERMLQEVDPDGKDHEVHRFGHWACGWFEILVVRPGTAAAKAAEGIESALADYPVLDDDDHCEREQAAADETWRCCYSDAERIDYIREHRSQFEFRSFADMLGCVRGRYFVGAASELLS